METPRRNRVVHLACGRELNADSAQEFRMMVAAKLSPEVGVVEVDLAKTKIVDGGGLGALMALYEMVHREQENIVIRLLNPLPPVRQMFELARLQHVFEIVSPERPEVFSPATAPIVL